MTIHNALSGQTRRIAKPLLNALPIQVREQVVDLAKDYNVKSAWVGTIAEGWKCRAGEGDRFVVIRNETIESIEMVHSNTVGASGLCHKIGARFVPSVGTWVIRIHYYTKYWMDIVNIVPKRLEER